jgi:aminocarboxymuconate-semialdehyde decarboxylase
LETIDLDIHAHIAPILPGIESQPGVSWQPDTSKLDFAEGGALASPSVVRPEALLAWMQTNRVRRAWISAPPPLYRLALDAAATRVWTDYLNAAIAEVAFRHATQLAPMFHLPVQHPALAASIAREIVARHPGHARFAMAAGSARHALVLSDAEYGPLWAVLNQASASLLLHPVAGADTRLDAFFLHNLLGGPGETALAAAHLAMSGVLERYPAMRVILAHGGGSAAAVAGRIERGQTVRRPGAHTGARPARAAFRDYFVDCITHSAPVLHLAAEAFGPEHILFGSDWPFSMGLIEPHVQLADVDPALRARIFSAGEG